jgi:hypothetical protein
MQHFSQGLEGHSKRVIGFIVFFALSVAFVVQIKQMSHFLGKFPVVHIPVV